MADQHRHPGGVPKAKLAPEVQPISSLLIHPLLQDPKFLIAVVVLLLSVLLVSALRPKTSRRIRRNGTPTVLLLGPAEGGKTSLFAKLAHSSRIDTHTSMISSTTTFPLTLSSDDDNSKPITLVDLPGHPRLRDEARRALKTSAAVVFVVDIQALLRNSGAVTEELPPILTTLCSLSLASGEPLKLLILASKADLLIRPAPTNATPSVPPQTRQTAIERLQSILTREMDRLKQSRAGTGGRIEGIAKVQTSGGSLWKRLFGGSTAAAVSEGEEVEEDEGLVWGGKGGFNWQDVDGVEISWGVSALGSSKASGEEGDGLNEIKEWLWDI